MNRILMKQCLDAMQRGYEDIDSLEEYNAALIALEAELAKPEPEPVAWMTADGRVCTANTKHHAMANSSKEAFGVPLYLGAKT